MTGCFTRKPVSYPLFSCVSISAALVPWCWHSAMKDAALASRAAIALASGWSGASAEEARAEQRVGPRGEHLDDVLAFGRVLRHLEADQQSLRAADPVRLHQAHLLRPAVERLKRVEQVLRVVGDLEHPLRLLALLDERARAPASAVDHLLIGEHRLVDRIPIHLALLAIDQAGRAADRETASAAGGSSRGRRSRARATSRATAPCS